ncbi:hypothetical protein IC617_08630 [Neiella sp. HB171785]|uniref:Uncharacterized protein n=1 Tax=Neiella litorisoli TaxID=2771431 RepID=A0A8J6UG22_9GAMM|nr:hypothetical protein [Neiella litorisoli]MBD1389491.1 hypothetical protein [Neiella litorisoli]
MSGNLIRSNVKVTTDHADLFEHLAPINKRKRAEEIRALARIGLLAKRQNLVPNEIDCSNSGQHHIDDNKTDQYDCCSTDRSDTASASLLDVPFDLSDTVLA